MTISLKHEFVSAKADGLDVTRIQPSNWNDEHVLNLATSRLLGRTTAGAGAVEEISVGAGLTLATGSLIAKAQLPPGVIIDYAGASAPTGWLLCYGQQVSRTDYALLFAAIGTTFGPGNGTTTFNVPDLRGRVVAGLDSMGGADAGRLGASWVFGAAGGAEFHTLIVNELPAHFHTQGGTFNTTIDPGHQHTFNQASVSTANGNIQGGGGELESNSLIQTAALTTTAGSHFHTVTISGNTTATGGGAGHSSMQPTAILNKIIFTGVIT